MTNLTLSQATASIEPATLGPNATGIVKPRRLSVRFENQEAVLDSGHSGDAQRIVQAALAILAQGEELLRVLASESFSRCVPAAFNASIGGHYRHCLDHFGALLRSLDSNTVDYDHRDRDRRIETHPDFALAVTCQLRAQLEGLPVELLDTVVSARCEVSYAQGQSPVTRSTLGRELVYAIAHAIHHYALISVMARLLNVALPPHFGVAPSTLAHQRQTERSSS
jgi:hypothetical protein